MSLTVMLAAAVAGTLRLDAGQRARSGSLNGSQQRGREGVADGPEKQTD